MKKRRFLIIIILFLCLLGSIYPGSSVEAKVTAEQKKEYTNALSELIRNGTISKNMDIYGEIAKTSAGKKALKNAAIHNRAALMAEGIDFLDSNWSYYYAVSTNGKHTVFNSTKMVSRKTYRRRYRKIMKGAQEVLSCVEASMTDADKAMAIYYYLAKNTTYENTSDAHTGYDVLVNHTGVCDGFANAYALVMNMLDIPCVVVSSYSNDHSWNMVQLDGTWYLCDLTDGVGTGEHEGMVVSYASCLVGVNTFLETHEGYTLEDIYGEGNSNGMSIQSVNLSDTDYISGSSAIGQALSEKTCLFYEDGYWYWIAMENVLNKSTLKGRSIQTVYVPADGEYIGWVSEYNGIVYLSVNDKIYQMDYDGTVSSMVWQVSKEEYNYKEFDYFWQLAYVGRFYEDSEGNIGYYITDLKDTEKGSGKINGAQTADQSASFILSDKKINLRAGYSRQLYVTDTSPATSGSIRWKSSNTSVAKVDSNGYVTARKKGTAVITAYVGKKRIKCTVKVTGYTIIYKKSGTNSTENVATASGSQRIILAEPERKGYVFEGWYTDKNYQKEIKYIKKGNIKNYVLYARWRKE